MGGEEEEAKQPETVVIATASADKGGDDNLIFLVDKLYHDAFANNSINLITSREFYCTVVGLLGLEQLDKKRKKAVKDQLTDLTEVSRRKATAPPFDSATLDLSTHYEDFGNNHRDGSGEGKGKNPDQEIDDLQKAPGGTTSNKEDELDKTGIIFKLIDKEKKSCLTSLGSYVNFDSLCLHKGLNDGEIKSNLSAQLFSAPKGNRPVA